jgi:hypothetical protein
MTVCAVASARAQASHQPLDTAGLSADARAVYRTWRAYSAAKVGRYSTAAGERSPYWSAEDQKRWLIYDLAGFYLSDDAVPEPIAVEPTDAAGRENRVVARFRSPTAVATGDSWRASMTVTTYAVRENDRWVLANALDRNTRAWRKDTVGPITYSFPAAYPYSRTRAERAAAFVDSVASVFGVPRLTSLTYYLTEINYSRRLSISRGR